MKKIKKTNKKDKEVFTGTQVGMLVESFRDDVKIIAENVMTVNEKLDSFKNEMYDFRDEMYEFKNEMYEFRGLVLEDLDEIKERLDRIEADIQEIRNKKSDKKWLEERLKAIEIEVAFLRRSLKKTQKVPAKNKA